MFANVSRNYYAIKTFYVLLLLTLVQYKVYLFLFISALVCLYIYVLQNPIEAIAHVLKLEYDHSKKNECL